MSTVTESALPLSKLGGDNGDRGKRPRAPPVFDVLGFFRLLVREGIDAFETDDSLRSVISPLGVELADSGLLGFDLPMCLGGCGNEPILTVFRSVLPPDNAPAELSVAGKEGTEGEVMCFAPARGRADEDTARFAVEGLGRSEVRVLGTGNEGKGPVGGAIDGLDGRGSELTDMLVFEWATAEFVKRQLGRREKTVNASAFGVPVSVRYGGVCMSDARLRPLHKKQ